MNQGQQEILRTTDAPDMTQGVGGESNQTPVLIYIPGLGTSAENSADVVADVIAEKADIGDRNGKYTAETAVGVVTPPGLTGSKKVSDPGGATVLQLFQLNYRSTLDASTTPFAPSVGPGAVRATTLAIVAAAKWWAAARRPGKKKVVKLQLFALAVLLLVLLFAAATAVAALLVALGVPLGWFGKIFGTEDQAGRWALGVAAFGTISWAALRKKILGMAKLSESLVHFVNNDDQLADNIAKELAKAINDLTDAGWEGPIHLLGYSFGSLVVYEAMFPREASMADTVPAQAVRSLTTIGCPLDIVRLYEPGYVKERVPSNDGVSWTNIFNPADIMSSNLFDDSDTEDGVSGALPLGETKPLSHRYLKQTVGASAVLITGRMHANYWGKVQAGPDATSNCFKELVPGWIAAQAAAPVEAPTPRGHRSS